MIVEQTREQLTLRLLDLPRQTPRLLIGQRECLVEIVEQNGVAGLRSVLTREGRVDSGQPAHGAAHAASQDGRVAQPEDIGVGPTVARQDGVLGGARQQPRVLAPSLVVRLAVERLVAHDRQLRHLLLHDVALESFLESHQMTRHQNREADQWRRFLVLEEDLPSDGKGALVNRAGPDQLLGHRIQENEGARQVLGDGRGTHQVCREFCAWHQRCKSRSRPAFLHIAYSDPAFWML